jgi:hypothetical protein
MQTTKKLFTKSYYKKLEEKKYAEPTDRAAKIIEEAEKDDRLKLEIRIEGRPKVIEASRYTNPKDISIFKKEPFDSEVF